MWMFGGSRTLSHLSQDKKGKGSEEENKELHPELFCLRIKELYESGVHITPSTFICIFASVHLGLLAIGHQLLKRN